MERGEGERGGEGACPIFVTSETIICDLTDCDVISWCDVVDCCDVIGCCDVISCCDVGLVLGGLLLMDEEKEKALSSNTKGAGELSFLGGGCGEKVYSLFGYGGVIFELLTGDNVTPWTSKDV